MEEQIAKQIIDCFEKGNIVFSCGNGGSFDLSAHFEEELICKFKKERKALPAIALKAHTSTANDYGYEYIFARQVQALGGPGDVLIAFSTSGQSKNVNRTISVAKNIGLTIIDFPREGNTTAEIQEYQLHLMHAIVEIVEDYFAK